ncbi:MAG: cell division FtsZ family protein [Akkermansiaceae bacterium]|nr:cell division FtsZ family protein [Akkermansiaceae bacterium]
MLPYQTISQKENGIAIVGIGGAGANVLQCFGASSADIVRLFTMSLDERVGRASGNVEFIQLGEGLSHGLGSGGDPEVGRQAMAESEPRVRELLKGCKLLVMVVGLGGGTGSGAAPVLARMAREAGVFLVSVIMMPFSFEGKRRREQAEQAHEEISRVSDIVFCFENDYMEELFRSRSGAREVFEEVDRLLAKAAASVPMMATSPGLINLGLDELASALENRDSRCIFGSGSGYGANRAEQAARAALESPLVSYHSALRHARAVIVHLAGGESMSLSEIRQAMELVREALAGDEVEIFFGATVKPRLGDEMRITLIASIDAEEFKNALHAEAEEAAAPAPELAEEVAEEPEAAEPPAPEPEAAEPEAAEPEVEDASEPPVPDLAPEEPEAADEAPAPEEVQEPEPARPSMQQLDLFHGAPQELDELPVRDTAPRRDVIPPSLRRYAQEDAPSHADYGLPEDGIDLPPSVRRYAQDDAPSHADYGLPKDDSAIPPSLRKYVQGDPQSSADYGLPEDDFDLPPSLHSTSRADMYRND